MPEHHMPSLMETIDAQVAAGLTDADVIELWLHRQPSPLTRSLRARYSAATLLDSETVESDHGVGIGALRRRALRVGTGEYFGWADAGLPFEVSFALPPASATARVLLLLLYGTKLCKNLLEYRE